MLCSTHHSVRLSPRPCPILAPMTEYVHVSPEDRTEAAQPCRSSCTARKASPACARPARSPPRSSTRWCRMVVPGVTTGEIDALSSAMMRDRRRRCPATLGYRGYTKSCCTSINHVVCHGIPGDKALKDGDIVNIDVTPDPRWLAWRHQPHVPGRRRVDQGAQAGRRDLRMPDARARAGAARQSPGRHQPRDPGAMPKSIAMASSAISAAMASGGCSTTAPKSSTPAAPAPAPSFARACSSPSSR